MSQPNITREQLVTLIKRLARDVQGWNDVVEEPGERGRDNKPLVIVLFEDGSGVFASTLYGEIRDLMNVQQEFDDADAGADWLIKLYGALERTDD